jgi:amino acid adenylation domain-containing protein
MPRSWRIGQAAKELRWITLWNKTMADLQPNSNERTISVIIPAYNSAGFLVEAIESALNQTQAVSEVVVVDDGSTDDTKSVCDRYPSIKYIYQANQGLPGARNKGIEVSQGSYLIFLDADDCLFPEAVEIGMDYLDGHPEAGFVFGRYLFRAINPDGSYSTQPLFDEPPLVASYATILAARHNIQCATAIIRREAIESVGGFAPKQEDLSLFLRIAREYPIYFHDRVVSEYRYHGGNESSKSAKMLVQTLDTHSLELAYIRQVGNTAPELMAAYECGRAAWIKFYGDRILYDAIRLGQAGKSIEAQRQVQLVSSYDPELKWVDREAYDLASEVLQLQDRQQHSAKSYPQTRCLHQLFEERVEQEPDRVALVFKNQQLTYGELNDRSNQLAYHLQSLNVGPETLVGISLERSLELIIGLLGILKAGGAYVPLDPTYPQERLDYMLEDSQVAVLVTKADLAASFGGYSGSVVCIDAMSEKSDSQTNPVSLVTPDNLIYTIYTSGSTGKPKGVLVTHANVGRLFAATQNWYHFDDRDVWTMFHSYAFDFSVWELWGALIYGGRLVIVPFEVSRSPQDFYELLARERVTVLNQTPSAFRPLSRVESELELSLRLVIFGGEALELQSLEPWFARYGDKVPQLVNMYGITETTVHVTYRPISRGDLTQGSAIGCPIPDLELYILDEDRKEVSIGETGEMYVGGAGVARGYLNRAELTTQRFIINPFNSQSGAVLYRTGDLARYLANGDIEYLGRIDNQVKIRGFRIELGEIEAALTKSFSLQEAVVIVREDEPGDLRLVAYLVAETSISLDISELRDKLKQQLPDYMVPSAFVRLATIPLTPNGKIDRQALPLPDITSFGVSSKPIAAGNSTEEILREIWTDILRLERVGVEDNFFDLGGNSLLGVRVIDRIEAQFGLKISVVKLYQYVNIRSMSRYLSERLAEGRLAVETAPIDAKSASADSEGTRVVEPAQVGVESKEELAVKTAPTKTKSASADSESTRDVEPAQAGFDSIAAISIAAESNQSATKSITIKNNGVAVIGMVGRFPGANTIEELWENLCEGNESITFFEEDEIDPSIDRSLLTDPNYVRAKGVLAGAELFDASFFGISAREAEMMDPQTRIFLELAHEALENAGYTAPDDNKIGVYAGSADNTYFEKHLSGRAEIIDRFGEFNAHLVNDRDYLTTRASYKLNLRGPSINISTACSTSLVAIIQAYQGLLSHQCDLALAGGVSILTPQNKGYLYQEGSILTPDGHCRPFDANAAGTSFNNGGAIVVLKRLEDAIADGDKIYTIIKGVGINNDGADKVSFTAPSVNGQMGAILQAQHMAGVEPDSIGYIEAHGTGTVLGDPIEVEALTQAFRTKTSATQFCGIGSLKSNLGHLTAAAGVAGFIKTVLALYHRQIPPTINFDSPNPHIDFANSPFYVNDKLIEWKSTVTPRRAGVSSFGGGGTNAHVILEEPPQISSSSSTRPYQLLLLSGKTELAIDRITTNLKDYLHQHLDANLADVAYTLQQGRKVFNHRRFVVCQDRGEAIEHLTNLPPQLTATKQNQNQNPDVVLMFSGQGSQYVNMGLNLYRSERVFQNAIDTCADILTPILERDIRELIYPSVENLTAHTELLNQTNYTQPALFAIEYALAQLWQSWGIKPIATIGHSIGEYVSACLAGVFSLTDALKLVAARGKMMWDLPPGSMLSVRLSGREMESRLPKELAIAAYNSTALCVVSGPTKSVELLQQELEGAEIACRLLHTSHAFHSPMMMPVVAPFTQLVENVRLSPPLTPFISSVTGDWITEEQATNPHYWGEHLLKPVRFADGIQTLCQHQPNSILLEVGPRQTLTTLARQNSLPSTTTIASLGSSSEDNGEWKFLLQAIGQLWLAGVTIDWVEFYRDEQRHRLPLPTYPFERQRFWIEPLPHSQNISPSVPSTPIVMPAQPVSSSPEPRTIRLIPSIAAVFQATTGIDILVGGNQATFLELGLDSLSLTQVSLALKKKFAVKVTFRQLLFDCSTLETLAQSIDNQLPPDAFPAPVMAQVVAPTVAPIIAPVVAPTVAAAVVAAPKSTPMLNTANSSAIESLVQQQLQIMAQQLELLGGKGEGESGRGGEGETRGDEGGIPAFSLNGKGAMSNIALPTTSPTKLAPASAKLAPSPAAKLAPQTPAPGVKINKSVDNSLNRLQKQALANIIDRYVSRTKISKRQAQEHRSYLADPRTVSGFSPLLKEMVYPIVTDRAKGSRLWDEDGNEYIDLTNGFGLNFFGWSPDFVTDAIKAQLDKGMAIGPQTPLSGRVAKKIAQFTGMERVAFCNTGSEAVMAALRIARTVTGRDRVVLFSGSYHGTFDEVLVRPGADGKAFPSAPGVMGSALENILVLDYDAPESLAMIRQYGDDIAAILVEPVQSRHPNLQPQGFLQQLRQITTELDIALIIDEVITGFRVAPGGAQEHFGIKGDIATYGKVVGGGMPIGILTGVSKYMDALDGGFWQFGDMSIPEVGVTFFAGTFVRHPLALAATDAILDKLQAGGAELQKSVTAKTEKVVKVLVEHFQLVGASINVEHFSSWFYITFPPSEPYGGLLFYLLRERGIHIWENRPCFLTLAHSDGDIEEFIWAMKVCIAELQSVGFLSSSGNAIAVNRNLPPQPGAKLGKDRDGNPAWFINDPDRSGKYLQIESYG